MVSSLTKYQFQTIAVKKFTKDYFLAERERHEKRTKRSYSMSAFMILLLQKFEESQR